MNQHQSSSASIIIKLHQLASNISSRNKHESASIIISINQHQTSSTSINPHQLASADINQHKSASISINQHQSASAGININQHVPIIIILDKACVGESTRLDEGLSLLIQKYKVKRNLQDEIYSSSASISIIQHQSESIKINQQKISIN